MKKQEFIFFLILILFLTGCGSSKKITENDLKGRAFQCEETLYDENGNIEDSGYSNDVKNGTVDPNKIYYNFVAVHTLTFNNDETVVLESQFEGRLLYNETGNYVPDITKGTSNYNEFDYYTIEYQNGEPYLSLPGVDNKFLLVLDNKGNVVKINMSDGFVMELVKE